MLVGKIKLLFSALNRVCYLPFEKIESTNRKKKTHDNRRSTPFSFLAITYYKLTLLFFQRGVFKRVIVHVNMSNRSTRISAMGKRNKNMPGACLRRTARGGSLCCFLGVEFCLISMGDNMFNFTLFYVV